VPRRVAFFTDTYNEINGVALTSRQFTAYAERHNLPLLCVRGGTETRRSTSGSVHHLELCRGPLAFELDRGLFHDPMLWRLHCEVESSIDEFQPTLIHVVSPSDVSEIGAYIAKGRKLPLAISWHTNLHEFGAMRLSKMLAWMDDETCKGVVQFSEANILNIVLAFYKLGDVLYAPDEELIAMLRERTGKPVSLMKRGVDTELFHPGRRTINDGVLRLGYVGRIAPEKSVRSLKDLESRLKSHRYTAIPVRHHWRWQRARVVAGQPGIRRPARYSRGEDLANSYANMDVFVFPSRTDTFGNVVLEALASGVPAVVTDAGGPKFIVNAGSSGFIARDAAEFAARTAPLLKDPELRPECP